MLKTFQPTNKCRSRHGPNSLLAKIAVSYLQWESPILSIGASKPFPRQFEAAYTVFWHQN